MWFKYFKIIFGETFDTGLDSRTDGILRQLFICICYEIFYIKSLKRKIIMLCMIQICV